MEEAESEIRAVDTALTTAKQTLDRALSAIPAKIKAQRNTITREVEQAYPLPVKPEKQGD